MTVCLALLKYSLKKEEKKIYLILLHCCFVEAVGCPEVTPLSLSSSVKFIKVHIFMLQSDTR